MKIGEGAVILIAEDDDDDFMLTRDALREAHLLNPLMRVKDGQELLDYLHRHGPYKDRKKYPRPSLILLDLNMPRKDGREALREIKAEASMRHFPIVVLTTSRAEEDIVRSYDLGVNSFIIKPVTFPGLVDAVRVLGRYWFELVELPPKADVSHAPEEALSTGR
jgi:CheY-like chemotaxis protein